MVAEGVVDVAIGVLTGTHHGSRRVLISRRCKQTVWGGYWEFPGGKIEPGETARQCVAREFEEELGIAVCVNVALPVVKHRDAHGLVRLHPFYCRRRSGRPQDLQVAEHRWVFPNELRHYRFPPANQVLVQQLVVDLHSGDR